MNKNLSSKDIYGLNVVVTKNISEMCDGLNAKLFYFSTDLVYDGFRGSMLNENAKLNPVSLYAETKLMGELKIQDTFDNYVILRSALLFGLGLNHSSNHFHQMFKDLKAMKQVKLFTDQYRTPLSLVEAARIICDLVDNKNANGIINFGGAERVSRYELGEQLCEEANLDKNLLIKINLDDLPDLPKVKDVSMNTEKLKSCGIKQKTLRESIKEILEEKY